MSTYRADSELSRFNAVRTTDPFPVSADTIAVFQHAREISELTEGAFDVTVGPLVDAWGFRPRGQQATWPADADIARLKTHVGYERLEIDVDAATLRKTDPMTVSDLSALAKGYAASRRRIPVAVGRSGWRGANERPERARRRLACRYRASGARTAGGATPVSPTRPSAGNLR